MIAARKRKVSRIKVLTPAEKEYCAARLHPVRGPFLPDTDSYREELAMYRSILRKVGAL